MSKSSPTVVVMDPTDWRASRHSCPPGLLKEQAWSAAIKSYEDDAPAPALVMSRALAFRAWLAVPFSIAESSAPFWRAVKALDHAVRDHFTEGTFESTAEILELADKWVSVLAEWDAVP